MTGVTHSGEFTFALKITRTLRTLFKISFILAGTFGRLLAQSEAGTVSIHAERFTEFNRKASFTDGEVHLNKKEDYGVLWLNDSSFANGILELELKGTAIPGQSFVGLAFHGRDNTTFDAVYFRPFNFRNPERKGHSVQYISLPGNDWEKLREKFPGRYENAANPVPDPADSWFHVRIVVNYPEVKVYINNASEPALQVEQLSSQRQGRIGFWVGNGSEGWFRNLRIIYP